MRKARIFVTLIVINILLLLLNICIGSVGFFLADVMVNDTYMRIVMDIRLPRALSALLLGGALSLSGFLLQTFFHNPIAGPFVLGISSGAKMVVAIIMVFMTGMGYFASSLCLIAGAFVGALLSMGFVLILSRKTGNMGMLIVAGVMIGYICSAITDIVITFANDADIVNLHSWSRGSFSGMTWDGVLICLIFVSITFILVFMLSKPLNAYRMGDSYALSLGVDVRRLRIEIIVLSGLLSAVIVAFAGPISFVGVAAPHITKKMLGTGEPVIMIPACFLTGGAFCLLSDLIARTVCAPTELSISTVTAIFGVPVVLMVMLEKRRGGLE